MSHLFSDNQDIESLDGLYRVMGCTEVTSSQIEPVITDWSNPNEVNTMCTDFD